MNRLLLLLLVVAMLVLGLVLYRSRVPGNPSVDPHAAEEIRKAQKR